MYKNLKIYYNNIRGIKSKITALEEIIEELRPHIVSINETHLGQNENITISNYEVIYNNKKEGKMGTIIGIREDVKDKYVVIETKSEEFEATWIKFSNENNINIRIGTVYAPQECRTKIQVIKKMYKNITNHILDARKLGENIIIVGDFNTKIGKYINGNRTEVSKFGQIFLDLLKNEEMEILNINKNCKGKWTRLEGETKTIIDYVIVEKTQVKYLNEMIIDENKDVTPCHIVDNRTIYSDHCAIIINMNWYLSSKEKGQQSIKVINSKTLAKYTSFSGAEPPQPLRLNKLI